MAKCIICKRTNGLKVYGTGANAVRACGSCYLNVVMVKKVQEAEESGLTTTTKRRQVLEIWLEEVGKVGGYINPTETQRVVRTC